jgi:hypothetical protein
MWEIRAIAAILLALAAAVGWQCWRVSMTVDEPSHLISAHLYWHGRDRLPPRDMPPVIKILGGWPSRVMGLPLPQDLGLPGDDRAEWIEAAKLVGALSPERLHWILFCSRLPLLVFPLTITWILWRWARALHGPVPGIGVALIWALSPTALAHSAFLKNDLAATCGYLLFWFAAWHFWKQPSWARLLGMTGAAVLAAMAKMSMLFVPAIAVVVVLLRCRRAYRRCAAMVAAICAVSYLLTAAAYQFDMRILAPDELAVLDYMPGWFLTAAAVFEWLPIPDGLWSGLLSLWRSNASPNVVYFLGQYYYGGSEWYFIAATLLKMAIPTLILVGIGTILLGARRRTDEALWLLPPCLYVAAASLSGLQLGVRLALPAWPFLFLVAGTAIAWLAASARGRIAAAALLASLAASSIRAYPNGLSYFNAYAGPPEQRIRLLNDSNVDWGQALPELARAARRHRIENLRIAYFGFDKPERYFRPGGFEHIPLPWSNEGTTALRLEPRPGWYAISAPLLPGQLFRPRHREFFAAFQHLKPYDVPGGSILLYRID